MMTEIAEATELSAPLDAWRDRIAEGYSPPEAVARAACTLAEQVNAAAIITCTQSGHTARLVARYRPRIPIVAPTPRVETYRQLALVWGVVAVRSRDAESTDQLLLEARRAAAGMVAFEPNDVVVVTAGVPLGVPGATNLIRVETPSARPRGWNAAHH